MKENELEVEIEFIEPILGSGCANPEVHQEYIAAKAPTLADAKEEVAAINPLEEFEKKQTVFPRDDKGCFLWDYQVRGFLKSALGVRVELGDGHGVSKWTYKRAIDQFVFVSPRRIYLMSPAGKHLVKTEIMQRSLRAETMQGDRVALASSEMLPAGTRARFKLTWLSGANPKTKVAIFDEDMIGGLLDYGKWSGISQWRNGSFGRFLWAPTSGKKSKGKAG